MGTAVTTTPAKGEIDRVNWGLFYEPDPLDWIFNFNYEENTVVTNVTESIMRLTPQFTIEPSLAESFEQPDPLTLIYRIRQGVEFHDGSPMTTEDVLFSLRRHFDPESFWSPFYANVKGVDQTGPTEITVTLKQPDVTVHPMMATPAGGVGKAAYIKESGKSYGTPEAGPLGTGPFKFKSWASGASIVLERNEAYWDTAHRPKAHEIHFSFITQESSQATALLSGEIDGMYHTPYSGLNQLRAASSGKLYFGRSMIYTEILIVGTAGPLADHNIRRALLLAIDREALADTVYNGAATPLPNTLVPLPVWGYAQQQADKAWKALQPKLDVDLEQAKQIVKEAGSPTETMTIATRASFQRYVQIATIVQDAAKKIGLNVRIQPINPNDYGDLFFSAEARKGIDMFISENYADIPEPLEIWGQGAMPPPPNAISYNYNDFNNPRVTKALSEAIGESNEAKRAELVLEAQKVLADDPPALALVNPAVPLFLNNRVTGAPASFCYLYYPWARDLGAP